MGACENLELWRGKPAATKGRSELHLKDLRTRKYLFIFSPGCGIVFNRIGLLGEPMKIPRCAFLIACVAGFVLARPVCGAEVRAWEGTIDLRSEGTRLNSSHSQ